MSTVAEQIKEGVKKAKNGEVPAIARTAELPAEQLANWGVVEDLETTDLLVPKIFHQQSTSKFFKEGNAKMGDFCDSLTGEVLASVKDKLEIIIFGSYKTMIVSKLSDKNRWELVRIDTVTTDNAREMASVPMTEEKDDGKYRNSLTYNFYCLLPSRIGDLPYVLTLGSTKVKAAKKLNTMIYKLSLLKKPGAAVVFELNSIPEKNDQGEWMGLEVNQGRATKPDELLRAHAWYIKSKSQKIVAAEEDMASAGSSEENEYNI